MKRITLSEISKLLGGSVVGDPNIEILGITDLGKIEESMISPLWEKKFISEVVPGNILLTKPGWTPTGYNSVEVDDPRRALILLLNFFNPFVELQQSIHSSSVVSSTAKIGKSVHIGPNCIVSDNAELCDNVKLMGNVWIGSGVTIGANTLIEPGVVIHSFVTIGKSCIVHPNAVIGSDGFGFMPDPKEILVRIPQIGTVTIEDNVEIGSCTCIDRATFGDTHISKGTKIDALVKVGHNCKIGQYCIAVSQTGIAGSSKIGNFVTLAAQSGVANHATVGDKVTLGARTGVVTDVESGKIMSGFPAQEHSVELRQLAILKKLPELYKLLKVANSNKMRKKLDDTNEDLK
ncbi:MAG: UDP-3-O-(3-hydroxymyristoyl)glucosamine N-acyltransferase [Synergistaceae bacterium]